MVLTAILAYHQRAIVRAFAQAGATSATTACPAEQLGLKPGMAWHQLVAQSVLRCPDAGRYFVDLANWERLRRQRRRTMLVFVVGALAIVALVALSGPRPG